VNTIVTATGVSRFYKRGTEDVRALDDVSFTLTSGEFVAIVGASGSGKSTLLHLLGAMDKPTSGSLTIAGNDVATLTDTQATKLRRDVIGFVFQDFGLLPTLTVAENVALPLGIHKASSQEVRDLIERVGLGHRMHHRPEQLSGGEMQRTAIARALVRKPKLLLADEPTGNLDTASGDRIVELLRNVNKTLGVTLVIVTHNPALAALADRQLMLADGHLVDNS
jgi:ABC-type dipeptide/oligopeptide/nickel transport system ATPase component